MTLRYSVPIGTASKFAVPATDSGRVYVGTRTGQVFGFGRPTTTAVAGTPTDFGLVAGRHAGHQAGDGDRHQGRDRDAASAPPPRSRPAR